MCRRLIRSLPVLVLFFVTVHLSASETGGDEELPEPLGLVSKKLKIHDYDEAVRLIKEMDDQTHPKYLLLRALQYEMGIGVEIDSDKALIYANQAAEQNDWEAAQYLAWRAISAQEDEADLGVAMDWREKLETWKKENPSPRIIPTTLLYPDRNSYLPLYQTVSQWNHEQAKAKDPVAQFNMFIILFDGRGIQPDGVKAMHWLMRAANAENGPAARWLSLCYSIGLMTKENPELALKYLRIAAAAGDAEAQYDLAKQLIRGRDVEKDVEKGVSWLRKAAEQDHIGATAELAEIYSNNELIKRDYRTAFDLYRKAVQLGDKDSVYDLAWMTFYGQGVEKDPEEGIRLFEEAAENGHSGSALRLAKIYLNGWSVERDHSVAKEWADKAIALGSDYAHYIHGRIHEEGSLGEVDLEEAFYQYELAAREGDEYSQERLGEMLFMGYGIERDLEEAYTWFKLAGEQGLKNSQNMVLLMEGLGWGTEQNPESLILAVEKKSGNPLPEAARQNLLESLASTPETDPFYGQIIQVDDVRIGTELEGLKTSQMTDEQRIHFMQLHTQAVEEKKRNMPAPDPAEEAEVQEIMEKSWKRDLKEAIKEAGNTNKETIPKPWLRPPPPYPEVLLRFRIEEELKLVLHIGKDGHVIEHKFDQEPLPQFRQAFEFVLPKWRFIPSIVNGKPVDSWVKMNIPFKAR